MLAVVTLLFLGGAVWIAVRIALAPPNWYAPPDVADSAARELGERVEYRLVEELQRVRPPAERWTLRLTDGQLNAWLASRLPAWWRTESGEDWPASVGAPQIRSEPNRVIVVIAADLPTLRAGASAEIRPQPQVEAGRSGETEAEGGDAGDGEPRAGDGSRPTGLARLSLRLEAIGIGRGNIPPSSLTDRLLEAAGARGADAERMRAAIADPAGWLDELIELAVAAEESRREDDAAHAGEAWSPGLPFRLADGRPVRLVAVGFEQGAITVTFEGRVD